MGEEAKEPKKGKRKGASALFIPAGLYIGLGAGFLVFAIVMVAMKD